MNRFILLIFVSYIIIINVNANANNKRDPFVSLKDKAEAEKEKEKVKLPYPIKLEGVMCGETTSLAILNGEIVKEGEQWREFKIEKIEKDRVILKWGDKKIVLTSKKE